MRTNDLRRTYLEFFRKLDHKIYASAPLVPADDPSLLFTVAGMVQFKDALLGVTTPEVPRAASCQVCMRAGGKHNDLDNVGYTARHNTLFEMLGNFSFGDYFKEEAIEWAWEFVVQVLNFEKERIWITTHPSDEEARELWVRKIGIRPERVVSHEDNFWEMGATGPCGPNTEIFYDQGAEYKGGPPGTPDEDGDRFLEFWNLVFPQFDRQPDGDLAPLDTPGVDTGLGLERTAALVQGVASNYEIDLFQDLIFAIGRLGQMGNNVDLLNTPSVRVIADHIRSCAFLIGDGVLPSNEGRGYVLRRIIRRALRHGHKLGFDEAFFHRLVSPLVDSMGDAYPSFARAQSRIEQVLLNEEEKFESTLRIGMSMLEREIENLAHPLLQGALVFKLYDTYGFPIDLTQDIARERGLKVDSTGFQTLMDEQRERARSAGQFEIRQGASLRFESEIEFDGYQNLEGSSVVVELFRTEHAENQRVDSLEMGEKGLLVLDRTGFYAEAGGQIGDTGVIETDSALFAVTDTQRVDRQFAHLGSVEKGRLLKGDRVTASVDSIRRQDIARNHTGTHLLHAALKNVLGPHVSQRGSLVAPDRLRFDFSHDEPLTQDEIEKIEDSVNEHIALNTIVKTDVVPYDEALEMGAVALFGEKYGEIVRVLNVGNGFSVEFCGGTHVASTAEIGLLRIVSQSGIAAGVRRVEAITGRAAQHQTRSDNRVLNNLEGLLQSGRSNLVDRLSTVLEQKHALAQSLEEVQKQQALNLGESLANNTTRVSGIHVVATLVEGDLQSMMSVYDDIRSRLTDYVIVLSAIVDQRIHFVCGISKNLVGDLKAGELVGYVGSQVGARGGGKPEMARAGGGTDIAALPSALESVVDWVRERRTVAAR